jgi:DNA polymerase-1
LGSPKQLSSILFDKLGLKPVKKTKTGYSTDAGVLEILSLEHPLPERILEYRQYAKIKSTYLDVLEDVINPTTGRIHSTFHQTVTATGRLSSSEPNLQNIPVRGELGRSVRKIFIPAEGRLLLASDYSQIELRIMAHMANDPSMIDAFRRGEDIHSRTASEMFGVPIEEVDSDLRSKAKAVNFGVIYGISDFGLARNTGVTREEAKHFIATYFERYPKIKEFMDECIRAARESGFAITILGRRRPIPDINARIKTRRAFAERTAVNTPIQGSAADLIKLAMVRIYRRLKKEQLISRLILQVHDELIFEVPAEESDYMRQLVREEMEGVMNLRVPLKVDIDVGKNWYEV